MAIINEGDRERCAHKVAHRTQQQNRRVTAGLIIRECVIPLVTADGCGATQADTINQALAQLLNPHEAAPSGTGDRVRDRFRRLVQV